MGIVLFSESGAPELVHALGTAEKKVERFLLLDAFRVPPVTYCEADVVLLDCGMNVDGGLRALRGLKDKCPATPVIFVTDAGSEDTAIAAFRTGARDYFRKPVDVLQLREIVATLADLRSVARERRMPAHLETNSKRYRGIHVNSDLPDAVLRAVAQLEDHFTEDVTLDRLAEIAGMSKFHFTRIFKRYTGMSPVQFRTYLRIEKARHMLANSSLPVSRIASDVGFKDISNFIRHFKRLSGFTPNRYRSRSRRGNA